MKKIKSFLAIFFVLSIAFVSCKKDDEKEPTNVDKTELMALYDDCVALHDGATEGTTAGQFATGSKATFKVVIDAAKTVIDDDMTLEQINSEIDSNTTAIGEFPQQPITLPTV